MSATLWHLAYLMNLFIYFPRRLFFFLLFYFGGLSGDNHENYHKKRHSLQHCPLACTQGHLRHEIQHCFQALFSSWFAPGSEKVESCWV